jgi:aldehyde:ferredoxin oxidoreductase
MGARYYAGKILWVDLCAGEVKEIFTSDYSEFVGGIGIAAKIYWDEVSSEVKALSPDNKLIFITGPLSGFSGFASSRWEIAGKSPITVPEHFSHANLGGSWGVALKFAGYDGIVVEGAAEKPVYLLVEEGRVSIMNASYLWGKGAIEARNILQTELGASVNVVVIGPAAEKMAMMSTVLANQDASGRAGFGAVMGSKKLKAIAVRKGSQKLLAANPEQLQELLRYFRWLVGRGKLTFYEHMVKTEKERPTRKDYCWRCAGPCIRESYKTREGKEGKFVCQAAFFSYRWAWAYYKDEDNDVPFLVTKLCDELGLDTMHIDLIMTWLDRCYQEGLLTEKETSLPLSKIGSWEFSRALLYEIACGNDLGKYLRLGVEKAAELIGKGTKEIITDMVLKAGASDVYGPRMYIAHGIISAMEPTQRIDQLHETSLLIEQWREWIQGYEGAFVSTEVVRSVAKRFWGSEAAADFFSYEGKALAAKMIQDRQYAKNCLILCDWVWPIMTSPNTVDHVGDPTLESKLFSAITGQVMDEEEYYRLGEKVLHFHRMIMLREGHRGRQDDILPDFCYSVPLKEQTVNPEMLVPGKGGEPVSRKGSMLDREAFEQMKNEYYRLRKWDIKTGLPDIQRLKELGLDFIP